MLDIVVELTHALLVLLLARLDFASLLVELLSTLGCSSFSTSSTAATTNWLHQPQAVNLVLERILHVLNRLLKLFNLLVDSFLSGLLGLCVSF